MVRVKVMMVLHAYQPPYPIQERIVLDRIIENCYNPITSLLEKHENVKLVINMNASLTEMLLEAAPQIIESLVRSSEKGKVEFLESGAYHPILPLISLKQAKIQLELNNKINSAAFGQSYRPRGVWPPELAVNLETLQLFADMGYSYVIVPENSIEKDTTNKIPYLRHHRDISLICRNKNLSNSISFNSYKGNVSKAVTHFKEVATKSKLPIVIATDMETFGEHNPEYWNFMFDLLSHPEIQSMTFEALEKIEEKIEITEVFDSSWSTEDDQVKSGVAYPLWDHPMNPVHTIQHTHFAILEKLYEEENKIDQLSDEDLRLYLKSAQSCQFWWADKNHGRWSPDIITKGINLQREAILRHNHNLSNKLSDDLKKRLDRLLAV